MHPSLAWRSTILQIAWLGGVIALALAIKDPAIQYTLVGAFAGYGGALIQKARQSASGGNDTGSPGGLLPGPMGGGTTNPPSSMAKSALSPLSATQQLRRFALGLVMALALIAVFPNCKGASVPVSGDGGTSSVVSVDTSGCTLVSVTVTDGTISVCINPTEVLTLVALLADKHADAGYPGALPSDAQCINAKGTQLCGTPTEFKQAMDVLLTKRASIVLREAGAP